MLSGHSSTPENRSGVGRYVALVGSVRFAVGVDGAPVGGVVWPDRLAVGLDLGACVYGVVCGDRLDRLGE